MTLTEFLSFHQNFKPFLPGITIEKIISIKNKYDERILQDFKQQPVHAVAGIGHPDHFFQSLRKQGLEIIEHAFPDHYLFQEKETGLRLDNLSKRYLSQDHQRKGNNIYIFPINNCYID